MKIISGGQLGADQAALAAAVDLKITTGGYAPKNFMTECGRDNSLRDLYHLEDSGLDYKGRTELNVIHSDVTIWFGENDTPGYFATKKYCRIHKKEFFDCTGNSSSTVAKIIVNYDVVNVAGTRDSMDDTIYKTVYDTMTEALELMIDGRVLRKGKQVVQQNLF